MLWMVAEFTVLVFVIWASFYMTVYNNHMLLQQSEYNNN